MFHIVRCHHGIGINNNVGGEDCSKLCRPLSLTEHCKLNRLLIKNKTKNKPKLMRKATT